MATVSAAVKKKKKRPVEITGSLKRALDMALTKGKSFDPKYVSELEELARKKAMEELMKKKPVPKPKIIKHPVLDRKAIMQTDNLIKNYLEPAARKKKTLMLEDWVKKGV